MNIQFTEPPVWQENEAKEVTVSGCRFSTAARIDISNFEYYYLVNDTLKLTPSGQLTEINETMYEFPAFTLFSRGQSGRFKCVVSDTESKYLSASITSGSTNMVVFKGNNFLFTLVCSFHIS